MFSTKSLLIATAGVVIGLYVMDNYLPALPVIGGTGAKTTTVRTITAPAASTSAYVP